MRGAPQKEVTMFVEKSRGADTPIAGQAHLKRSIAHVAIPRRTLGGLLLRKECWVLSWWAKIILLVAMLASGATLIHGLYPFLAVTQPIAAKLLVVEGWMPAHLAGQVARQYETGRFEKVLLVRGLRETGDPYESGEFWVNYMAKRLVEFGIPKIGLRWCLGGIEHRSDVSVGVGGQEVANGTRWQHEGNQRGDGWSTRAQVAAAFREGPQRTLGDRGHRAC